MEISKAEVAVLQTTESHAAEQGATLLNELQLAVVGGGIGDVVVG